MRILALSLLLPLAACNSGDSIDTRNAIPASGSGSARTYAAADFTAVDLRGPDDVDVRVGSAFSVRAEGDSATLDRLVIARDGGKLRIGRKTGFFHWGSSGKVKVFVTMPRITAGALAGSGDLTIDRVDGSDFHGSLAGSGNMKIGRLAAETSALSIAGSGSITVDGGDAARFKASIAGSGDITAAKLAAREASVDIAGSGSVKATVDGPAQVSIMGSGDVDLGAKAKCDVHKVGSGEVRCGG
ncbi:MULTISPECIES: head GIN domain-containing protein [Sphingomonas]|uniref:DUF2807 domain-containing protein n=1 Tax=Sphingomonas lycopersici TaxID=2951807 RepID=A0AA42CQ73_9SPHN|nr:MULTISPECIES: head GIN domain-containing protein [Sphingomonas]MCW6531630.1 DUF2807 domain-containing protein [Sphingomonas lycopersici]MCW6535009.1 DUF2807 domain-containing protein [Sphingomonas lycopersici]OJU16915.1 MAG: DUF2807 domain-containing protein [Sphingomonas sp. 66-10]